MTDTAHLVFEDVKLPGLRDGRLNIEVPARTTVVVLGSEASGVDQLGNYALGLDAPSAGRTLVFGEDIGAMSRREALDQA